MARKKGKKGLRIALCVILAVMLAGLLGIAVCLNSLFGRISRLEANVTPLSSEEISRLEQQTDPVDPGDTRPVLAPEDVVWDTQPAPTIGQEDYIVNILLIGQDRRPGEGRQRSDAMILCTINLDEKTMVLTSFLRDTYVRYPEGYRDNRLNAAYQWGGMPLLNETLELNFGIHVDGNVEVDFNSFVDLVDMLGGVNISLTEKEAAWLNKGNGWSLGSGMQELNGEKALAYARIRKLDSDFGRTNRQRKIIVSLVQSCKNSSAKTLRGALETALSMVATDMTDRQIMALAMDILPILKDLTITTQHIPAEGAYTSARIRGMSVLVPDLEENRKILQQSLKGKQ